MDTTDTTQDKTPGEQTPPQGVAATQPNESVSDDLPTEHLTDEGTGEEKDASEIDNIPRLPAVVLVGAAVQVDGPGESPMIEHNGQKLYRTEVITNDGIIPVYMPKEVSDPISAYMAEMIRTGRGFYAMIDAFNQYEKHISSVAEAHHVK